MKLFRKVSAVTAIYLALTLLLGGSSLNLAPVAEAQSISSQVGSNFYASNFLWSLLSDTSVAAGAGTVTFYTAEVTLKDSRRFIPFSTLARLTVMDGTNSETVTPTAVSGCNSGTIADSCQVTATFANAHGKGVYYGNFGQTSASFGLDEAALAANNFGGGTVALDQSFGGTDATIIASPWLASYPRVLVADGSGPSVGFWRAVPGLTAVTTPTALTTAATATLTTSITGGSIATSTTPRFAVTCVDFFGGESAASADAASTATLVDGAGSTNSYSITAAGVPVSTGCVGYRLYVSASAGATQSETLALAANVTGTVAPLCPLPACWAVAQPITLISLPATTNAGPPQGTSGAATSLSAAHTTVVAAHVGSSPTMMPFVETAASGFFPVSVTSATTLAAGFDVMGELQYPAGYFNSLGATYRVCGGGVTTPSAATVAGTWTLRIGPRQNSAGTSGAQVAVPWNFSASTLFTAALAHFDFCADITTNAVGASGTVEGGATYFCSAPATPTTATTCNTAFNAVSTATDLTQQGVVQVTYVQSVASWTLPQLQYMSIRRL